MNSLTRVAIVVSHPIQHFCPLYSGIAKTGRVELRVFFGAAAGSQPYFDPTFNCTVQWQDDLLVGYDYEFLPGGEDLVKLPPRISNRHLPARLNSFQPDVVQVYGYLHGISRAAMTWARRNRKKVLFVSDSELRRPRSLGIRALKRLTVPLLLRGVDAFLTVGDHNEAYFKKYGADPRQFYRVPFPIDEPRYQAALDEKARIREEVRVLYSLPPDAVVALCVGKLAPRKQVADAIQAVARLWQRGLDGRIYLLIAGDGPDRPSLERLTRQLGCDGIRFAGFVPVTKLPDHYVSSDFLVHPSESDPHPLATSEAVFCGLPVIASDRVGSIGSTDDVRLGVNGFEYPFGNIEQLASTMETLIRDHRLRESAGRASLSIGRERTLGHSVAAYLRAVIEVNGHMVGHGSRGSGVTCAKSPH